MMTTGEAMDRSARFWIQQLTLLALQFKEDPDAWLMVDKILSDAQYPQTKCASPHRYPAVLIYFRTAPEADTCIDLGLQVLDNVILTRWKVLPRDQCQGKSQRQIHLCAKAVS